MTKANKGENKIIQYKNAKHTNSKNSTLTQLFNKKQDLYGKMVQL